MPPPVTVVVEERIRTPEAAVAAGGGGDGEGGLRPPPAAPAAAVVLAASEPVECARRRPAASTGGGEGPPPVMSIPPEKKRLREVEVGEKKVYPGQKEDGAADPSMLPVFLRPLSYFSRPETRQGRARDQSVVARGMERRIDALRPRECNAIDFDYAGGCDRKRARTRVSGFS